MPQEVWILSKFRVYLVKVVIIARVCLGAIEAQLYGHLLIGNSDVSKRRKHKFVKVD